MIETAESQHVRILHERKRTGIGMMWVSSLWCGGCKKRASFISADPVKLAPAFLAEHTAHQPKRRREFNGEALTDYIARRTKSATPPSPPAPPPAPAPDSELMKAAKALVEELNREPRWTTDEELDARRRFVAALLFSPETILARVIASGVVSEAQVRAASGEGA